MNAMVCDRCGKKTDKLFFEFKLTGEEYQTAPDDFRYIQLCKDCKKSFYDWMFAEVRDEKV